MPSVKVSEATGSVLDWMVAKCMGFSYEAYESIRKKWKDGTYRPAHWMPSTDWAQGGPIIDREKIDLFTEKGTPESWVASMARYQNGERLVGWRIHMYGPTPLIAVMRCYVASKLGEVVKVPQELL